MNSDPFFDELLGIKPGKSLPNMLSKHVSVQPRRRRRSVTAAVARGNLLAIATVEADGMALRLTSKATGCYELVGREQEDTIFFARNIARALSAARVSRVLLRVAP